MNRLTRFYIAAMVLMMSLPFFAQALDYNRADKVIKPNDGPARVYVLGYHHFSESTNSIYTFSLSALRSHIKELKEAGFNFVSFSDITNRHVWGTKNILITVDDGYRSVSNAWCAVFRPAGITPLLGIPGNAVDNYLSSRMHLTSASIRYLLDEGVEIASHGYAHEYLTEKFFSSNQKRYFYEINASKDTIDTNYNIDTSVYVYAGGCFVSNTWEHLDKKGYSYAMTCNWGSVELPMKKGKTAFHMPRYVLSRRNASQALRVIISREQRETLALSTRTNS